MGILLIRIFPADPVHISPSGRAVLLSPPVVLSLGIINSDAYNVGKCEYQNTFHRVHGVVNRKRLAELFRQSLKDFK